MLVYGQKHCECGTNLRSDVFQVQPDVEDLINGDDDGHEKVYLGKLNFSIDYNYGSSEVSKSIAYAVL